MIDNRNYEFWDILKGVGILSIVLGHSCWFAFEYVYMYHLAIFFFVSGFLYNEKKYGEVPFNNVGARLQSTWIRYVIYVSLFVVLHNWFLSVGILPEGQPYSMRVILANMLNSVVFSCSEQMGGALWFVPVLIISSAIFGGTVWLGNTIKDYLRIHNIKYIVIALCGVLLGMVGVMLNIKKISLDYHIHTAFLVIPIFTMAYFCRLAIKDLDRFLKYYVAIPLTIGLFVCVKVLGYRIELSAEQIIGPLKFYLVSFSGIYLCLYLAKIFLRIPIIKWYFSFIGKYSFDIMALHLVVIKLIDIVYAAIIGETDKAVYSVFVNAYSKECWWLYALLGTLIPATIAYLCEKLTNKVEKRFRKTAHTKMGGEKLKFEGQNISYK